MHLNPPYELITLKTYNSFIMLDFHQKRKVRAVLYHHITLVALFILVLVILHSTWAVYKKERESQEMKNVSLEQVKELKQRNDELTSKIDKLATVSGVEEEIRSKFSVVKNNENMVVVVPNKDSEVSTTSLKISFWQKIWSFFNK